MCYSRVRLWGRDRHQKLHWQPTTYVRTLLSDLWKACIQINNQWDWTKISFFLINREIKMNSRSYSFIKIGPTISSSKFPEDHIQGRWVDLDYLQHGSVIIVENKISLGIDANVLTHICLSPLITGNSTL